MQENNQQTMYNIKPIESFNIGQEVIISHNKYIIVSKDDENRRVTVNHKVCKFLCEFEYGLPCQIQD